MLLILVTSRMIHQKLISIFCQSKLWWVVKVMEPMNYTSQCLNPRLGPLSYLTPGWAV